MTRQNIKLLFVHILPKLIIFGLALFNFIFILSHRSPIEIGTGISFVEYTPWYDTTGFFKPIVLLIATFLLAFNKRWSYLFAIISSGFIVVYWSVWLIFRKMTLLEEYKFIQELKLNIFLQEEIQFFLAIIVFSYGLFYLLREMFCKDTYGEMRY